MNACPQCGLQADYIPGGKTVRYINQIRELTPHEFHQCGVSTSYDPQSGPIYCGQKAKWVGRTLEGEESVFACERHESGLRRMLHDYESDPS